MLMMMMLDDVYDYDIITSHMHKTIHHIHPLTRSLHITADICITHVNGARQHTNNTI